MTDVAALAAALRHTYGYKFLRGGDEDWLADAAYVLDAAQGAYIITAETLAGALREVPGEMYGNSWESSPIEGTRDTDPEAVLFRAFAVSILAALPKGKP